MATVDMLGIKKAFGPSVALEDFNLSIASGELVCLLGPSGCGKTTALRILAGFERPDAGSVEVDGRDLANDPPEKRQFGMVFQDYSLFPNMTARQNIDFGLRVQKRTGSERTTIIDRMIEVTGLQAHADKYPHQMSGGQKQRVAIARALVGRPKLLVLDEPTSALDVNSERLLQETIATLKGSVTMVIVAHRLSTLDVCDRLLVLRDGQVEAFGCRADLERESDFYQSIIAGLGAPVEEGAT